MTPPEYATSQLFRVATSRSLNSSICIPRIETSITKEYIFKTLLELKIGYIQRINEIPLRNDPTHKRIIINLQWNNHTENAAYIQKTLTESGSVKIVHDMPWYWKVVATHPQT